MNRSFYNGVSGIKTHQFGMDVWSHNISNINNAGYKAQIPEFSNILSQSLANSLLTPANSQVGLGSQAQTTAISEKIGGMKPTDNEFDLALTSEGWFGTLGYDGNIYYTRQGDFNIDAAGNLVDSHGQFVLGTMDDGISSVSTNLANVANQTKITLPKTLTMPPVATSQVGIKANLDPAIKKDFVDIALNDTNYQSNLNAQKISINGNVTDVKGLIEPKKDDKVFVTLTDKNGKQQQSSAKLKDDLTWQIDNFDVQNLDLSEPLDIKAFVRSNQEVANKAFFSTAIIGQNGEENVLKLEFKKIVPQQKEGISWHVNASIEDKNKNVLSTNEGQLEYTSDGAFLSSSIDAIDNVKLDFGKPYNKELANSGFEGVTSFAGLGSYVGDFAKDGSKQGELTKYSMDDFGQIQANFDNGKNASIAKIAVYHFVNDQGLDNAGGNYFTQSSNSGKAIFYTDTNGQFINNTKIKNATLEMSNVDLGTALTEVIVMQKAFDASSKSITTSDQLLQVAINLKK